MKTFKVEEMREAMNLLVDKEKKVIFTLYVPQSKSVKIRALIETLYATPEGYSFSFVNVYVNRKRFFPIKVPVKRIRWIKPPTLFPFGRMLSEPESALLTNCNPVQSRGIL